MHKQRNFEKQKFFKNLLSITFCVYICNVAFRFAINLILPFILVIRSSGRISKHLQVMSKQDSAIQLPCAREWQNSVLLFYSIEDFLVQEKKRAPNLHQIENTVRNYLQSEMHFLPKIAANIPCKR